MRQGTSRVIVIACSENFFYFLGFDGVLPDFEILWHIIHFTRFQFSLCNSYWSRFLMPITSPRDRQNVEMIRITNQRTDNCFWLEKIEKILWISSKCCLFTGKFYPKVIFCHFGDKSFIKNVMICFIDTFCHLYSFPSPSADYWRPEPFLKQINSSKMR